MIRITVYDHRGNMIETWISPNRSIPLNNIDCGPIYPDNEGSWERLEIEAV